MEAGIMAGEAQDSVTLLSQIKKSFGCKEQDVRAYSPLALAYMGDAVFDLVIRSVIVERANRSNNALHKKAVKYVKAETQARMVMALIEQGKLTQEEEDIYKRGRNAKSQTTAKNASVGDYRKATGLEALIGYLYLTDRMPRVLELIKEGIALIGMEI